MCYARRIVKYLHDVLGRERQHAVTYDVNGTNCTGRYNLVELQLYPNVDQVRAVKHGVTELYLIRYTTDGTNSFMKA